MSRSVPRILLCNDDGIEAVGLRSLVSAFDGAAEVWVVAPDRERSAVSHAISLHSPLRLEQIAEREFSVDGTPSDCVYVAINHLLPGPPDLVVSGINMGANLGTDVHYSGTVAAAMEGAIFGLRAMAVSQAINDKHDQRGRPDFSDTAALAVELASKIVARPVRHGVVYNVNTPDRPQSQWRGIRLTRLGYTNWADDVEERVDPRGRPYYWIGGERTGQDDIDGSDNNTIAEGYATITPIYYDLTDSRSFAETRSVLAGIDGYRVGEDTLGNTVGEHPVHPFASGKRSS